MFRDISGACCFWITVFKGLRIGEQSGPEPFLVWMLPDSLESENGLGARGGGVSGGVGWGGVGSMSNNPSADVQTPLDMLFIQGRKDGGLPVMG